MIEEANKKYDLLFQHTAARRRLPKLSSSADNVLMFQHTAARRRLHAKASYVLAGLYVSTHSRTEAAARATDSPAAVIGVSTHSRTEAAA